MTYFLKSDLKFDLALFTPYDIKQEVLKAIIEIIIISISVK